MTMAAFTSLSKRLTAGAFAAGLLLVSFNAFGFGRKGHTIVAHIAEVNLTSQARAAMRADLCGEILSDIANWGDDIHNDPKYEAIIPLHYVQIPGGAKTYEESQKNPAGDLAVATQALVEYLKSGDEKALEKVEALKNIGKQAALKLLVHFYGDLHQPLHVSNAEDKGGNTIKVNFFGRPTNLHSVWDEGLLEGRPEWDGLDYGNHLVRHFKDEKPEDVGSENIVKWVDYSYSLHDKLMEYPDKQTPDPKDPPTIAYLYTDKFMPLLERQLWLAGVRLAHVLNEIYK